MSNLQYNIIRALYNQAAFSKVDKAYEAANAVIDVLGLSEKELEPADG